MATPRAILAAALRRAPRRYRLPALPPDAASAEAAGPETALASYETARLAREAMLHPDDLVAAVAAAPGGA